MGTGVTLKFSFFWAYWTGWTLSYARAHEGQLYFTLTPHARPLSSTCSSVKGCTSIIAVADRKRKCRNMLHRSMIAMFAAITDWKQSAGKKGMPNDWSVDHANKSEDFCRQSKADWALCKMHSLRRTQGAAVQVMWSDCSVWKCKDSFN